MKKSFDEYKELYAKANTVIEKEPILQDFEIWVTLEWLKDRFPSMKNPGETIPEISYRATYFDKKMRERLHEICIEDPRLAETLKKGLEKMDSLLR